MNEGKELVPMPPDEVNRRYPTIDLVSPYVDSGPRLRDYWELLFKRRWTVLAVVFVAVSLTAIASFKTTPVYRATVRLEVEGDRQGTTLNSLDQQQQWGDLMFLQTQVQVVSSDHLAWMTIENLGLDRNADFAGEALSVKDPDRRKAMLIERLKKGLKVELVRDSRLVEPSFEDPDPARCAAVVNTLARNYVEYNFRKKYEATAQATEWMTQELDTLKAKVEKSQQALVSYEQVNAAINIDDKQNITLQKLSDLTRQMTEAQGDRIQKESSYRMASGTEGVPSVLQGEFLSRLLEKQAELQDQHAAARTQYGANWPAVAALKNRLTETTQQIEQEQRRIVSKLRQDYLTATSRESALQKAVAEQKKEATKLNQLGIQYTIMKREAETNQNLYNMLLQRMKEAGVSAGLRASNIHIVDQALPPLAPVRPRPLTNIAISLVVGLVLGITCAFVQEFMDTTVKTPVHVEQATGMLSLGIIPMLDRRTGSRPGERTSLPALPGGPEKKRWTLMASIPESAFAEAYRKLRTSFLLSQTPDPPRVAVVTSAMPREGKTSVAVNLAIALAQKGASVLLIDADMRRPRVHTVLGLENTYGLSTMLADHTVLEPLRAPSVPNLWVLPCGPPPANPADALSSPRMEELIREYRQTYDHVVLDSPPLGHFTDAVVMSHLADGALLVAAAGSTSRETLGRAFRTLTDARCNVLGVVLNRVNFSSEPYYYSAYAYRYYHYYYGKGGSGSRHRST